MSYYGKLCTQLYELDKPTAPEEELDFYMSYAQDKELKILEPMCGSGRFLIPFLEKGYKIDGFDISKDMLQACKNKCEAKDLKMNVLNSSIEEFEPRDKYNLIIMPGGSFSLLIEDEIVLTGLRKLKEALYEDGTLLIEILTPIAKCGKNDIWNESNRKTRNDGKVIVENSKSDYDDIKKVICFPLKYELYDKETLLEKEEMYLFIKLYEINEIVTLLKQEGFETVKPIKAYNKNEKPSNEDEVVVLECRLKIDD